MVNTDTVTREQRIGGVDSGAPPTKMKLIQGMESPFNRPFG
jgi:hypothetical protein